MKHYEMRPMEVCSTKVVFDLDEDDRIRNTAFTNGCNGNLKAISKLVEGRKAEEVINLLKGNRCGDSITSGADQFARCLAKALRERA